ncbi:adenosine deaminase [Halomonas piscis]|uniref:Adenine deaminase n=1 Tax=Halomonas piscis TaxID=3031727 RepID=A0ABY9YVG3_9GAMM|nr:adenosine deaminase [Halomonas piscis]WNK18811.1 adenosine deaminase [Halomonas piscis]
MRDFLQRLPKAELHLHIEGTLEPELMFRLAERNHIALPYADIDEVTEAYRFRHLQEFLDLYYQGMDVLRTPRDFHDLAMDYFVRARNEGVMHIDMHFDPQAHMQRGVPLASVMQGLLSAVRHAERTLDLSVGLIMAFLRDRPVAEAAALLEQARDYWPYLSAVGLDSAERGYPPGRFADVFARAGELGLARVAHAGEEGPAAYVREALDELGVERIDHGVQCMADEALVERLRREQTVLTVCPLSNVSLGIYAAVTEHPLPAMWEAGLNVTLSSDDPAYFGGGMLSNHLACAEAFGWGKSTFLSLGRSAISAGFMPEARRQTLLGRLAEQEGGSGT